MLINIKRTSYLVDFAVLVGHRMKFKERKITDKYIHFAKELKKLWNMRLTVRPFVAGGLGMVSEGLERRVLEL